ncbi:ESX secretion-associated protein EspG [Nocardia sp. NPDC052566]|uniref:ESX secretion-associated protein EspG n=1 Tax=Nocardia sp. NPDC052566 TaxID=3364330 RepID=UPI0037C8E3A5
MGEWTWEPDDFAALWFSAANDRFPRPLHHRSRFTFREDFDTHRTEVRESYDSDEMEEIQLALHTLTTSDVRIEILGGTTKHRANDGSRREYRLLGARNLYHAVVLFQSAANGEHGQVRLRTCSTEALPARIVNFLPGCNPGSAGAAVFHAQDLARPRDPHFGASRHNDSLVQYKGLLDRPVDGGGNAGLLIGPIHDRPSPRNTLRWYDITDDGRYTEQRTAEHITVRPTVPQDLAAEFTTWINKAVQQLREETDDNVLHPYDA